MATVLRDPGARLRRLHSNWLRQLGTLLLAVVLALVLGRAEAAPSASYGSVGGWDVLPPASGGPGYGMNYQATIEVDGVYVGKTAYMKRRALNAAKLAGTVLASAVASPVVGVALDALIGAGLNYLDGKLVKPGKPDTTKPQPYLPSPGYYRGAYDKTLYSGDAGYVCQHDKDATGSPYAGRSYILYDHVQASGSAQACYLKNTQNNSTFLFANYSPVAGCAPGDTLSGGTCYPSGYVPPQPVPVTSAADPVASAAMNAQVTGMTPQAAQNLADWARSQGIDLGTFTDYNGNVIAGPFDFPLPAKTSSSIDPTTGLRYDTNVVQSVHVDPNPDPATSEQDPLKLTQNETKTEKTTNPDGSSSTKTTTTTTSGAANQQQQQDTGTPFNGPDGTLYTAKTKTFADVFGRFVNTIKASAWYTASAGFFSVTISGGTCPHWTVVASKWLPALDAGQFVCSDTMTNLYRMGGVIVLIVAAWAAFRIAFL